VYLVSPKAIKEFKNIIPEKLDRCDFEKLSFGKLYANAFDKGRSTVKWRQRQHAFFRQASFKSPEKLIPILVDCLEDRIKEWAKGPSYSKKPFSEDALYDYDIDLVEEFSDLGVEIVLTTLFGEQFWDQIGECNIRQRDGGVVKMNFTEAIQQVSDELNESQNYFPRLSKWIGFEIDTYFVSNFLPWLNTRNLIEPFKTDQQNIDELYRVLKEYLIKSGKGDITDFKAFKVRFQSHLLGKGQINF
jgi:hypothetical protein